MEKIKALITEYGPVALGVWFSIFALCMVVFTIGGAELATAVGVKVDSGASTATTIGLAYVATKVVQPLRVIATIALTPIVGKLLGRGKKLPDPPAANPATPDAKS